MITKNAFPQGTPGTSTHDRLFHKELLVLALMIAKNLSGTSTRDCQEYHNKLMINHDGHQEQDVLNSTDSNLAVTLIDRYR